MASIEKRIVSAFLSKIRERKEEPLAPARDLRGHSAVPVAPAKLREARFSDFAAVAELKKRWGLAADSLENWERLWRRNPALAHMPPGLPIGWVLEADGKIVGYLGNIFLLYRYGDRILTAVAAHGCVVEPPYRSLGASLVAAFFRQRSVDLHVATTTIAAVGKIARAFKADPLPQADYDTVFFWVLQPAPLIKAVMKKLGFKPYLLRMGAALASLALATDTSLRRRWPRRSSDELTITDVAVNEIGDDFHDLWMRKIHERPRLFADRNPATLRWHFEIPGDRGITRVLCCSKKGKLLGYAVIRHEPPDETDGLRKSLVADVLVAQDEPAVVEALLVAAYGQARQAGSHILEVMGFPQNIRQSCAQWRPYHRKYAATPYHYKAADPILHKTLSDGAIWYASPYDGDATLIRPSHPHLLQTAHAETQPARDVAEREHTPVV